MATPTVLGNHSPELARLRDLKTKAGRRAQQRFAIEGRTMLAEALRSRRAIEAIYATEAGYRDVADLAERASVPTYFVSDRALARASDLETPPGSIAVVPLELDACAVLTSAGEPILLLAEVADPGNVGTLLRSAEIFGVRNVVFAASGVEPHNPKVVRASMGAIFRLRLAVAEPADVVRAAEAHGYSVIATAQNGSPLPGFAWPERPIIAVGNERHGVAAWLPRWDFGVAIPQSGEGESLNAAVAGSIVLYAYSLARAQAGGGP